MIVRFGMVEGSADSWPDVFQSVTANLKCKVVKVAIEHLQQACKRIDPR
jgi:hypothetical protein